MKKAFYLFAFLFMFSFTSLAKGDSKHGSKVKSPDDTYCTSGSTYIENGGYTVTCTKCSQTSMFDAQVQVSDCLMDARARAQQ